MWKIPKIVKKVNIYKIFVKASLKLCNNILLAEPNRPLSIKSSR